MDKKVIYTFGYTLFADPRVQPDMQLNKMFSTLQKYKINYLIDVRSVPFSGQFSQFNADKLKSAGRYYGIPYVHMPELGAKADSSLDVFSKASDIFFEDIFPIVKSNRPDHFELNAEDEIVDFHKFRTEDYFLSGIQRIQVAYDKGFTLCLMCSEKKPMDCHRYFLVCKTLNEKFGDWLEIRHFTGSKNPHEGKQYQHAAEHADASGFDTKSQQELNEELNNEILNKGVVKKFIFNGKPPMSNPPTLGGFEFDSEPSRPKSPEEMILEKYEGTTQQEQINDFCDRFWNLYHGWRRSALWENQS